MRLGLTRRGSREMPTRVTAFFLRLLVWGVLALLGIVAAYFILRAGVGLSKGYGFATMDWNGDGWTTPAEIIQTSDIGDRPSFDKPDCTDYFAYKDARTLKTVCPYQGPTGE